MSLEGVDVVAIAEADAARREEVSRSLPDAAVFDRIETLFGETQIDAAVNAAVAGLKAKNTELLGTLKERQEALKRFDGIDPDAVRNIISKFANDEEAALIAKGEIDKVLNNRTERMKAGFERETQAERAKREAAEARDAVAAGASETRAAHRGPPHAIFSMGAFCHTGSCSIRPLVFTALFSSKYRVASDTVGASLTSSKSIVTTASRDFSPSWSVTDTVILYCGAVSKSRRSELEITPVVGSIVK